MQPAWLLNEMLAEKLKLLWQPKCDKE